MSSLNNSWSFERNYDEHLRYAQILISWIEKYRWLFAQANVRFFSHNLWKSVPEEWNEPLLKMSVEQLQRITTGYVQEI